MAPTTAGYLADPLMMRQDMQSNEMFTQLLTPFPFLLRNLLGAIICWITAVRVYSIIWNSVRYNVLEVPRNRFMSSEHINLLRLCMLQRESLSDIEEVNNHKS